MSLITNNYNFSDHPETLAYLKLILKQIGMTQQEMAAQFGTLGTQLGKAKGEIVGKFADLEAAVGSQTNVSPELQAAFEAFRPAVQALDDLIPDVVVTPDPTEETPELDEFGNPIV